MHAVVHGDVQGVGFRDFVWRRAERLGLTGWVRNRPDGCVECVAEGERARLDDFLEELRRGPALAEVEAVDADWESALGDVAGFEIRS